MPQRSVCKAWQITGFGEVPVQLIQALPYLLTVVSGRIHRQGRGTSGLGPSLLRRSAEAFAGFDSDMAITVWVKVVGFSDAERHSLNTIFRVSRADGPNYVLWKPEDAAVTQCGGD